MPVLNGLNNRVIIRDGQRSDLGRVMELVLELAEYEKGSHEVTNTLEMMERDGFGPQPVYGFFVAEFENEIIGISIYYFRYSTWKGKRLYLEDIIVTKKYRGKGVGKLLFEETIEKARQEGCTGLMWQVLEWNQPAIEFYKKYQTKLDGEWINCHLDL